MESRCVAKYLRVTPRKMRLVADIVRGLSVNDAIGLLKFTPRAGARPILKAIQSAVANIVNRDDAREVNPDDLVVKTILVDGGPSFRRFMPRAMGRATPIRKRMSHVTVTWLIRLRIGVARPIARGIKRRKDGPSSTKIVLITNSSGFTSRASSLLTMFATAD